MSNITFQEEKFSPLVPELKKLVMLHREEVGLYQDKFPLDVMWDFFSKLDEAGSLATITARKGGELVGYYIAFVQPHPHYQSTLFGINDVIFIHKEHRKGFVGIKLIKMAEKVLKEKGVKVMTIHFKTHLPFDPILERLGWDYAERLYTKYIGDD